MELEQAVEQLYPFAVRLRYEEREPDEEPLDRIGCVALIERLWAWAQEARAPRD